ncbi:MAG: winged helix-turn-helix transcriptional regulator [Candidatus Omnitrophica bacterium]|nr:winged helix-turn-helix transcriptional regulator [Candidatus Omnitrophota bacterium]
MKTPSQIAEEIAMIGPRIGRKILADLSQVADIPPAQMFVLMFLSHNGPMRTSDIVHELKVAAPTATGIVDRLQASGYAVRSEDKSDRRAVIVELTAEGKKIAGKLRSAAVDQWTEILSKISRDDAEKYLEILRKINEAL